MSGVSRSLGGVVDTLLDRTVAPGYTNLGYAVRRRLAGWPADPAPDALAGRHVVVTGVGSGLGAATARGLADLGAVVHAVARSDEKASQAVAELAAAVPGGEFRPWACDVSDLDDVRRFAAAITAAVPRLDAVVHNAGVMPPRRTESAQGHELTMATHVLGPVAMTDALRPVLAPGARVVLVTSGGMYAQRLIADDPEYRRGDYSPTTAYARSKRAQVDLLERFSAHWDGVEVFATHPGWADTPGVADSLPGFHKVTGPFLRTDEQGADTTVWLVAHAGPLAVGLWHDRRRRPRHLLPRTRVDDAAIDRMWSWVREAAQV